MKKIAIYGNNYLEVIKLIDEINSRSKEFEILGFLNDLKEYHGKKFMGIQVLGGEKMIPGLKKDKNTVFFNNVNSTLSDRRKIASILDKHNCQVVSLIHPSINVKYAKIGYGSILVEGCVVGINAKIGNYLTCRFGTIISHNVILGDFVYLGPRVTLCGFSILEDGVYLGAGSTILPYVRVGAGSVIGAGSLVTKDILPGVIAYGNPAKVIKKKINDSYRGSGM